MIHDVDGVNVERDTLYLQGSTSLNIRWNELYGCSSSSDASGKSGNVVTLHYYPWSLSDKTEATTFPDRNPGQWFPKGKRTNRSIKLRWTSELVTKNVRDTLSRHFEKELNNPGEASQNNDSYLQEMRAVLKGRDTNGNGVSHASDYDRKSVESKVVDFLNLWSLRTTRKRKWIAFINPASGKGAAPTIWKSCKDVLLQNPNMIEIDEVYTTKQDHAREVVRDSNFDKSYSGIIVVSGDGLVHEIFRGLTERNDDLVRSIPIAHVPGGSGNALATSLLMNSQQALSPIGAALLVMKNQVKNIDLWDLKLGPQGEKRTSFLSWSWGLVSDIDIDSEGCRCIGGVRFTVCAVSLILRRKVYKGKLHYIGYEVQCSFDKKTRTLVEENDSSHVSIQIGGNHVPNDAAQPLTQNVSGQGDWKTLDNEKFMFIWATNVQMGTEEVSVDPLAKADSGYMHLLYCKNAGRLRMAQIMLGLEDGTHLSRINKELGLIKCTAFRFEPEPYSSRKPGYISVDGELVPFGMVEGSKHSSPGKVMCM